MLLWTLAQVLFSVTFSVILHFGILANGSGVFRRQLPLATFWYRFRKDFIFSFSLCLPLNQYPLLEVHKLCDSMMVSASLTFLV